MKVRIGFVANSSSASFILDRNYLTDEQIGKIIAYNDESKEGWNIKKSCKFIKGFTIMDNGLLYEFIKEEINPPMKAIVEWEDD